MKCYLKILVIEEFEEGYDFYYLFQDLKFGKLQIQKWKEKLDLIIENLENHLQKEKKE
jgi:hypothetical protein